jgi:uncharacterized protein
MMNDSSDNKQTDIATVDYSHEVQLHSSPALRVVLLVAGTLCVVVGLVGVVMPVLPTTPFLLLAAACYLRASARLYNRLLNNPTFGPLILEWRRYRSIPWKTKLTAIVLMSATLASSIIFFVKNPYAKAFLAAMGVALAIWLYRIPSRDRPGR